MIELLRKIMQDAVVEPMPTTTAAAAEEVEELAGQTPELWIFGVLLLVVIVLCFVFILNNKNKRKAVQARLGEDEKSSH